MFKPATKKQSKLRLALTGPSGSGKTFSALAVAVGLGEKIAVIDTEHGSASLYADKFKFDTCNLETFSPDSYIEAIKEAENAGYEVIIIDSLSHAWIGKEGALEQVDNATRRSGSKNSYFAWRDVTPKHNALIEAIIQSKAHIIATMRAKTEYALDKDDKGKVTPRKIGLAPIQREGMEYEFSVAGELDLDHNFNVTKTRCSALAGKVIKNPGLPLAKTLKAWLDGNPDADKHLPASKPATLPDEMVEPSHRAEHHDEVEANAAPATAEVSPRERTREAIRTAKSLAALEALVPEIQKLSELDREAVRPEYGKRKAELAKGAA
jgi:hypothetical protein